MAVSFGIGLLWAILAVVVLQFGLGFLWYGPLFGKPWMRAMGWERLSEAELKERQKRATPGYVTSIVGSIVATIILWVLHGWASGGADYGGVMLGLALGTAGWLAFYLPGTLTNRLFEGTNWALTWIGAGYWLACALIQGAAVGFFASP